MASPPNHPLYDHVEREEVDDEVASHCLLLIQSSQLNNILTFAVGSTLPRFSRIEEEVRKEGRVEQQWRGSYYYGRGLEAPY